MFLPGNTNLLQAQFTVIAVADRTLDGIFYRAVDRIGRDVEVFEYFPAGYTKRQVSDLEVALSDTARDDFETTLSRVADRSIALDQAVAGRIPNLISLFKENKTFYVVHSRPAGESLQDKLALGALDEDALTRMLLEILDALESCHANGLLHYGLDPDAVMIGPNNKVVLRRFGLPPLEWDPARPVTEQARSRLAYLPPECVLGQTYDARSDLYALAAIMYECISGVPPVEAEERLQVRENGDSDPNPPLATEETASPGPVLAVIDRALSLEPAKRLPDIAAWRAALNFPPVADMRKSDVTSNTAIECTEAEPPVPDTTVLADPPRKRRRFSSFVGGLTVASVVAVASALTLFQLSDDATRLSLLTRLQKVAETHLPEAGLTDRIAAQAQDVRERLAMQARISAEDFADPEQRSRVLEDVKNQFPNTIAGRSIQPRDTWPEVKDYSAEYLEIVAMNDWLSRKAALESFIATHDGTSVATLAAGALSKMRADISVAIDGGADLTRIADAIKHASPEARIAIAPGTYRETLLVDKPLTLFGTGDGVLIASSGQSPTVDWRAQGGALDRVTIKQSLVRDGVAKDAEQSALLVSGTLSGDGLRLTSTSGSGLFVADGGTVSLTRATLFESKNGAFFDDGTAASIVQSLARNNVNGIQARRAELLLQNSTIEDNEEYGVLFSQGQSHAQTAASAEPRVSNNLFAENGICGVYAMSQVEPLIESNRILSNNIGICIQSATAAVKNNEIASSGEHGLWAHNATITTSDNQIVGSGSHGVALVRDTAMTTLADRLMRNSEHGILVGCGGSLVARDIRLEGNSGNGISVARNARADLTNATIVNNKSYGVWTIGRMAATGGRVANNSLHGIRVQSFAQGASEFDEGDTEALYCETQAKVAGLAIINDVDVTGNQRHGVSAARETTLRLFDSEIFRNGNNGPAFSGIGIREQVVLEMRRNTTFSNGNFGVYFSSDNAFNESTLTQSNQIQDDVTSGQ